MVTVSMVTVQQIRDRYEKSEPSSCIASDAAGVPR